MFKIRAQEQEILQKSGGHVGELRECSLAKLSD